MKEQDKIIREISLTYEFLNYIIDNSKIIEKIPEGAELRFLTNDLPLSDEFDTKNLDEIHHKVHFSCRRIFEQVKPLIE